jgi:hypothetical protein
MTDQPANTIHTATDIARIRCRAKMQQMAEAGFSMTRTAQSLGTSRAAVYRFAKSSGVVFQHGPPDTSTPDRVHEICQAPAIRVRDHDDYREAIQDMKPMVAVDHLLGLLDALTHRLPEMSLTPLPGFTLTRLEARLLHRLDRSRNQPVTQESLMFAMYQLRPFQDWPDTSIIGVRIFHLRRKLRAAKIKTIRIETSRSLGTCLRLSDDVRLNWRGTVADGEGA